MIAITPTACSANVAKPNRIIRNHIRMNVYASYYLRRSSLFAAPTRIHSLNRRFFGPHHPVQYRGSPTETSVCGVSVVRLTCVSHIP